jgi:fatty-acyl-CoA synthase
MRGVPHPLLGWLDVPHGDRGIRFAADDGSWDFTSYAELAVKVRAVAAALEPLQAGAGATVAVIMPTGLDLVAAIFGAWLAGAVVTVLVPPSLQPDDEYLSHISPILDAAGPALTICAAEHQALVGKATSSAVAMSDLAADAIVSGTPAGTSRSALDLAFLQFTSGSSGAPKGVRVTWGNLLDNLARIRQAIGWADGDAIASWLPLHHDMGFIGCLLFPVSAQGDLWLMRPDQFIRDPARWLECFDRRRATHSASPAFAFAYAARKVRPERLASLDLSGWKSVIVGADQVDPASLSRFTALAAAAGFSARTFQPAYGLAENTLLACAAPVGEDVRIVKPDWSQMRFGQRVSITQTRLLGPADPGPGWLPAHGLARDLRILDDNHDPLPDGYLGEIAIRGASVAAGYHKLASPAFASGELRTADAGFIIDGQLYVLGRMGDSIKVNGRSVYMEDLDARVCAATGLNPGRLCVVGTTHNGRTGVAVFAEVAPGPWQDAARAFLRTELGAGPDIAVIPGKSGLIKRTSSGKPRRRHMWLTWQGEPTAAQPARNAGQCAF